MKVLLAGAFGNLGADILKELIKNGCEAVITAVGLTKGSAGAQRLEKRQMARCGENAEYNEYANKTPIIIPLLPIYHLN